MRTIKEVHAYVVECGWTQANGKPVMLEALRKASALKKFRARKDGEYHKEDIDAYCSSLYINPFINDEAGTIKDQIERERLRKLQIENDKKSGELVPLSEEIKRRVAVIQFMKVSMINGRAMFMRQLRSSMRERHKDSAVLEDMLADAAEFYEDCVLTVFDSIVTKDKK